MTSLSIGVDTEFPDSVTATLSRGNLSKQISVAISDPGTLMAVGCSDGAVAIYDCETRAVAKLLKGHTSPVVAVCWSASCHDLLSASLDGVVIRWRVLEGVISRYATFTTEVEDGNRLIKTVQFHPRLIDVALISFNDHNPPLLIEFDPLTPDEISSLASNTSSDASVPTLAPRAPLWSHVITPPYKDPVLPSPTPAQQSSTTDGTEAPKAAEESNEEPPEETYYSRWNATTAIFDLSGRFIFEGNNKGTIYCYQFLWNDAVRNQTLTETLRSLPVGAQPAFIEFRLLHFEYNELITQKVRVPLTSIQSLVQSRCGTYLLANNSNQLKVYTLDVELMNPKTPDEKLIQHSQQCRALPMAKQVIWNGGILNIDYEKKLHLRVASYQAVKRTGQARPRNKARAFSRKSRKKRSKASAEVEGDDNEMNEKDVENEGEEAEEDEKEEKDEKDDKADDEKMENKEEQKAEGDQEEESEVAVSASPAAAVATPAVVSPVASTMTPFLTYVRSFSDQVNRVPWRRCCFSHSSDFVIAGSSERGEHRIHIWSIHSGQLTKILLGQTEGLIDLAAHPLRPLIVTCCTSGMIYMWNKNYVENWSAFAPDFEELDDNQEYVEREDEFDIIPVATKKQQEAGDLMVDIAALDQAEEKREKQLLTLPVTVLPDKETQASYESRKRLYEREQERKQQAAQEAPTVQIKTESHAMEIDQTSAPASAGKRPLDTATADAESESKKQKL